MGNKYQNIINYLSSDRVALNADLSKFSTFRIGGKADLFYRAATIEDIQDAVKISRQEKVKFFVIGGGTNLLISDKGFQGLVIKNDTSKISIKGMKGNSKGTQEVYIQADSGVLVNRLVRFSLDEGLSGLEAFLGQPGSVGGACWINAHNMNKKSFFADIIFQAAVLNADTEIETVNLSYFKFAYDYSVLQDNQAIVLSVVFKLHKTLSKEDLWENAQKSMEYRKSTQPQGAFSSGCIFRNILKSDALRLATPGYTTSVGYLIDSVGLKGFRYNGAYFSDKHANFILNDGTAKASDIMYLINLAKKKIMEKYHIKICEEIVKLGDF
jgi:UDP-N-acetylmuramate dehydrogenase